MGMKELIALLNLSSWCLVMVERLFLAVPWGCLQFVIVVFPDHTHLLFLMGKNTHLLKGHLRMHIKIASIRQFQCVPTTYIIEIKETYFEIYIKKYHVHWLSSYKHLKLPISIKIPFHYVANCLYLHDSFITKFEFMNYALLSW